MRFQAQLVRAHALGEAQQLSVMEHGDIVLVAELLGDLCLALIELKVAEWTDIHDTVDSDRLHVPELLVGHVKREIDLIATDASSGTAAHGLVLVIYALCAQRLDHLVEESRSLGPECLRVCELPVPSGLE